MKDNRALIQINMSFLVAIEPEQLGDRINNILNDLSSSFMKDLSERHECVNANTALSISWKDLMGPPYIRENEPTK